jgi:alpha-tubulin suppressor-like RCC1 family protein
MQQVNAAIAAGTWPSPPTYALFTWGQNGFGQLGLGNTTYRSSPNQVGTLSWSSVGTTQNSSVAIKNGTLWAWGKNNYGQLGLGNTTYYSSPKQVGALTNWSNASGGQEWCVALKTNGTLWSWGWGAFGTLGIGNTTDYSSPKQIGSLTTWASFSTGGRFVLAIQTNGTLWAWGDNASGQLGLNNLTNYSSPKQVGALTTWSKTFVNNSSFSAFALKTDGTLWSWGVNQFGSLGLGNTTYYSSPKQVGALTTWSANSSALGYGFAAVKTDGTLWTWGYNVGGTLGLGNTTNYSSPKQVGALTTWYLTGANFFSAYAIKTDGTLWSWGINDRGQLGLGNTTYYSSPKQIGTATTWQKITGASYFATAIRTI